MIVGAISTISSSSFFSFWKLDYFSDMNCLKNPLSDMISCSSSTQRITSDIRVRYWPRTYSLNINSIPVGEIPTKDFPVCVLYNLRRSLHQNHSSQFAELIVLYIRNDESVWHPNTEPKLFRTRFLKRRRPAEKFIFQIWHRPHPHIKTNWGLIEISLAN